jgi:hypothetical protein
MADLIGFQLMTIAGRLSLSAGSSGAQPPY